MCFVVDVFPLFSVPQVDLTVSEEDVSSESTLKELAFADEIKQIAEDDIRITTFLVFLKKWAKDRQICDTTQGALAHLSLLERCSSYSKSWLDVCGFASLYYCSAKMRAGGGPGFRVS